MKADVMVYGTDCADNGPLSCWPEEDCKLHATVSYKTLLDGLDLKSWTAQGGSTTLESDLQGVSDWTTCWTRRDTQPCGGAGDVQFTMNWVADLGQPNQIAADVSFECTACKWSTL